MEGGVHISLASDTLFHIGPLPVTNTLLTSTIIVFLFLVISFKVKRSKYNLKNGFYNFTEMLMEGFLGIIENVLGNRKIARQVFAILVTFFLFIIINNWFGIFPGMGASFELHKPASAAEEVHTEATLTEEPAVPAEERHQGKAVHILRATNSDLNMTLALALVSVIFIQFIVIRNLGFKTYLKKFFNFSGPIMFFVGILEIISEFIKILSFAFRLFGNIFAGEVLITVIYFLLLYLLPVPFMGMELFFGFIQALIFTMLTLVFIKASLAHEEH